MIYKNKILSLGVLKIYMYRFTMIEILCLKEGKVQRHRPAGQSTMSNNTSSQTIVITGGLGNLGSKLCHHLLSSYNNDCKVILIEHPNFINPSKPLPHPSAKVLPCDLGNPTNEQRIELKAALDGADTLIHFSAVNPYPNATWSER